MTRTLLPSRRIRRLGVAAVTAATAAFPATANGDAGGPRLIRIDPSTGARTVLAAGAPLSDVAALTVGPSGTVYVIRQRLGLYSLAAPDFAVTPVVTIPADNYLWDVAATSSTLYVAAFPSGVLSFDAGPPFARKVVSASENPEGSDTGDPDDIALSGSTLYGSYQSTCLPIESAGDSYDAHVIAIDTATGRRSDVANLGCTAPAGLAVTPAGSLLTAVPAAGKAPAKVLRVDPATGSTTTVSSGGALRSPADVALAPTGDLIVADRTSGLVRISTQTGAQSTVAAGGNLYGVDNVAFDAAGAIYATAPGPPDAVLKVSVAKRQRFSTSGIRISASCVPGCAAAWYTDLACCADGLGTTKRVTAKRTLRLKLPARVNRAIARRLKHFRKTAGELVLTPEDGKGKVLGEEVRVQFTLTR